MIAGLVLVASAALAMAWANSPWAAAYFGLLDRHLGLSVLHWINDVLMAVFFLVVGMEIKREFLVGELKDARRALLPIGGAVGGMVVPATIYALLNHGGPGAHGWGIPMATDIAFSLGVLSLLGARVPHGVTVFLTALAIADDLGAVLVIALFYTRQLDLYALAGAAGIACALWLCARAGERRLPVWLAAAPFLWWCMHASGVHATIAGVALGWTMPLAALTTLERALKPWVTWLVMPLFALANAGVSLAGMSAASLAQPVAAGVALGLLVGKPIGIVGLSFALVRAGWARLPRGATWTHMVGVGMLAGIGFTVALFVASLSFRPGSGLEPLAKIGILAASSAAAVLGATFLGRTLARAR